MKTFKNFILENFTYPTLKNKKYTYTELLDIFKNDAISISDIKSVAEWMRSTDVSFQFKIINIKSLLSEIKDMYNTYDEFPKDKRRTNKIVKEIKNNNTLLPIYIDSKDNFVMEGRHRMVAFYLLGIDKIPAFFVK